MILYMTILSFGTMIMRSVLEDKNQRITEVILSCISPTTFFTGKILGIGAVGMTQYLAWALIALLATLSGGLAAMDLAGISLIQPLTLFFFVLFYVLGFLFFSGLFAAVGAIATTDQEAQQLMQPLIIIVIVPIVAMMYILQNPDSPVAVVMSMIPLTSPLVMFMRVSLSVPPVWQLLLSIGILLASTALVFVASARIFRVGILITGKRASLAEAWRWVREA
jgi:ABC-2 type transport system permease protein